MRALLFAALLALDATAHAAPATTALVGAGSYRPLVPPSPKETEIPVGAFFLDRTPVTNGQFLAFVLAHPEWQRDRVKPVFAEPTYLAHWRSADALGPDGKPEQPAVAVSWFAARAYCASRGMRLPTEAEWEHAAAASKTSPDGASDPAWRAEILGLYSRPNRARLPHVGQDAPNLWGIHDLHGLVWEWVLDYASTTSAFSSSSRFCGATGGAATDATDFAAFERVAFRTSLRANYTVRSLGFRCAADLGGSK